MAYWCDKETFKLIELWGEDKIQAQLEGCKRNKEVFDAFFRKMEEAGYQKSSTQCRDKTKKLKKAYRAIKDKHGKTGEGRKKWLFLEVMDSVLGDKPATRPAVLIDTMGERVEEDANHEAVEAAIVEVIEEEGDSDFESERYPNSSPSSASTSGHEEPSVKVSTGKDDQKASPPRLSNAEKRQLKKRNKEERFEKAMTQVVDLVMKVQESSDSKFIELEEKRMKLEEKLIESEERQRQQDREFQMRMFAMIMQAPPPPNEAFSMHSPSTSYFTNASSPYRST